jgi:hypothetical protein
MYGLAGHDGYLLCNRHHEICVWMRRVLRTQLARVRVLKAGKGAGH